MREVDPVTREEAGLAWFWMWRLKGKEGQRCLQVSGLGLLGVPFPDTDSYRRTA